MRDILLPKDLITGNVYAIEVNVDIDKVVHADKVVVVVVFLIDVLIILDKDFLENVKVSNLVKVVFLHDANKIGI